MLFSNLSHYFSRLESTASRNKMTEVLAELFKKADLEEIDKICYLALGKLGPKFVAIQFFLAEKMMIAAISQACQQNKEVIQKKFKELGDLGDTARDLKSQSARLRTKLSVNEVYKRLREIAEESGEGSVERKIRKMARLLQEMDGLSAKYVIRMTLAKLRLGFSDMTILDALSWLITGDKSKRKDIETAYNIRADIGQIAKLIKSKGLKNLKGLRIQLGTPVIPALCQRLPNVDEMIKKMGTIAVEPKYDGQRLQLHLIHTRCAKLFTRNLDNVTHMFPDIIKAIPQEVQAKSVILDGEIIGIDLKTGKLLPFQETIKRKRKHQIQLMVKTIPLKFFCFDILYYNNQDLLAIPFSKRRTILEKILSVDSKTIKITPQIVTNDPQEVKDYHEKQIKKGLEGAVLKKWQAPYDPGRRGYTWVKFKSEKKGKLGGGLIDTLDCIIMGFYRGQGKRVGFGIGAFLVGIRKDGKFLTISKIGTGLTDKQWKNLKLKTQNLKLKAKQKEYRVDKNLTPDVWLRPEMVVEIEADNITKSPIHSAGYALRFPRLIRFRDDKNANQITSLQELKKLYKIQK